MIPEKLLLVGEKVWLIDPVDFKIVETRIAWVSTCAQKATSCTLVTDKACYFCRNFENLYLCEADAEEAFIKGNWAKDCIKDFHIYEYSLNKNKGS